MRSVKRMAKKCNPHSMIGRQVFTALGYAVLTATSKKEVDTLLGILDASKPIKKARVFYPKSQRLLEYEPNHCPQQWEQCTTWTSWWKRPEHLGII